MKAIREKLSEAFVRMNRVVLLAGAHVEFDVLTSDLKDAIDDAYGDLYRLFPDAPRGLIDESEELFFEWLFCESGKTGFLVCFQTPIIEHDVAQESCSYSWGYTTLQWEYGDTLDEVVEKGLAWAASVRAEEKGGAA